MSLGMPINDGLRAQELKGIITNVISYIIEFCIIFDNKYWLVVIAMKVKYWGTNEILWVIEIDYQTQFYSL